MKSTNALKSLQVMVLTILGVLPSAVKADEYDAGSLSLRAAEAAVKACAEKNFHVTATVVNRDGLVVAVLRD
jgi:hypothetical protein